MGPAMERASCTDLWRSKMKIKTSVRAGGSKTTTTKVKVKSSSINNTVVTYVPPVSRCVGI
jgi:hypothetical protein